jgi:ankyrin repeat protein
VLAAKPPLSPSELAEVLEIDFERTTINRDTRTENPELVLLRICPNFLQVVESPHHNSYFGDSKFVQFSHASVQDYLIAIPPSSPARYFSLNETSAQITLTQMCLITLDVGSRLKSPLPLYRYAYLYWYQYLSPGPIAAAVDALLRRFLHPECPFFSDPVTMGTPLHYASRLGLLDHMKALLDIDGITLNAQRGLCEPPLIAASTHDQTDALFLLLDHGADIEVRDCSCDGRTSLQKCGSVRVARALLSRGANVDARDACGETALILAARYGRGEVLRVLLNHGAAVDACNNCGHTPLHEAARTGNVDAVHLLLDAGAAVNVRSRNGETPLHHTAWGHHGNVALVLLAQGADADARDHFGCTPLHHGAWEGRSDIVQILLDHGAAADVRDSHGCTPLHRVSQLRKDGPPTSTPPDRVTRAEARRGGDEPSPLLGLDTRPPSGRTVRAFAARTAPDGCAVTRLLLDNGANVATMDVHGFRALDHAVAVGRTTVVRLLIDRGAPAPSPTYGMRIELVDRASRAGKIFRPVVPWYQEQHFVSLDPEGTREACRFPFPFGERILRRVRRVRSCRF